MKNLTAEAVADITTTGSTLRDNHLRILDDGLILRSQATLFRAEGADWDDAARARSRRSNAGSPPRRAPPERQRAQPCRRTARAGAERVAPAGGEEHVVDPELRRRSPGR